MSFGLDIGSHSLKIIQCQKRGQYYFLTAWGECQTPIPTETTAARDKIVLAEVIKKLVKDSKITAKEVVVALPESQVYSRIIQLPQLTDAELASVIEFEAEQYIPVPLDQVQVEFLVLNKPPAGAPSAKMDVLLIAAQKKAINDLSYILELADLVPQVLETEMLAVSRVLTSYADTSLLVNIGKNSTDLAIVKGKELKFVYSFPTGGQALTRVVSQQLGLDLAQAEEYKKAYGLDKNVLEGKVAQALLSAMDQITAQIQKTIQFYLQKNAALENIVRVVLAGGTALMPGLAAYLTGKIGLETVLANPFAYFDKSQDFPKELLTGSARFATSVGLALRNEGN